MDCTRMRALCVPEPIVSSIIPKGYTFATSGQMEGRLMDLMEQATVRCLLTAQQNSEMVWLSPYVIVGCGTGQSCFVSKRKYETAAGFSPFSLGLSGYCLENESADVAAARILYESLGYSPYDVSRAGFIGFVWIGRSEVANHIAMVYKVLIKDPAQIMVSNKTIKGCWMKAEDVLMLHNLREFDRWSAYLLRMQGATSFFPGIGPTLLGEAVITMQ